MKARGLWIGMLLSAQALAGAPPPPSDSEATLTSDELEIVENGAKTVFRGHVRLTHQAYRMESDVMTRSGADGPVLARGRVKGTWTSPSGERMEATGGQARYDPAQETVELWDSPRVTRYATAVDTAPVIIDAERFIAHRREQVVWAKRDVRLRQGDQIRVRAGEARYDQPQRLITAWGGPRVQIDVEDGRGRAAFESDQAVVSLEDRRARLLSRVRGRVTPRS